MDKVISDLLYRISKDKKVVEMENFKQDKAEDQMDRSLSSLRYLSELRSHLINVVKTYKTMSKGIDNDELVSALVYSKLEDSLFAVIDNTSEEIQSVLDYMDTIPGYKVTYSQESEDNDSLSVGITVVKTLK